MNNKIDYNQPIRINRYWGFDIIKLEKSVFKNTDTYYDQNVETEQVWLD